jgi:hypothetical protein
MASLTTNVIPIAFTDFFKNIWDAELYVEQVKKITIYSVKGSHTWVWFPRN